MAYKKPTFFSPTASDELSLKSAYTKLDARLAALRVKSLEGALYVNEFATGGTGTFADPYTGDDNCGGFQDAHDDLPATGGVLYLKPGAIFKWSTTFNITKPISIFGHVFGGSEDIASFSKIHLAANSNCDMIDITLATYEATGMTFSGFLMRQYGSNAKGNAQTSGSCFNITSSPTSADIIFRSLVLWDVKQSGIINNKISRMLIDNCWIEYCDEDGIKAETPDEKWITDNYFIGNKRDINIQNCEHLKVTGNTHRTTNWYAIIIKNIIQGVITNNTIDRVTTYDGIAVDATNMADTEDILIANNTIKDATRMGIHLANGDYISVQANTIENSGDTDIAVIAGKNPHGIVMGNMKAQPFGVIADAFDNTNHYIHIGSGGAGAPDTPSQDYLVCMTRCRLISSNSGNNNCAIVIKDAVGGNTIASPGSTCDVWLEPGWAINWGAYTGADPTVVVAFS